MKAPKFWSNKGNLRGYCLTPLSVIYALIIFLKSKLTSSTVVPIPVICVGNIVLGGVGKTPIVIKIAEFLIKKNLNVHIVSRGYGGNLRGPVQVDPDHHTASQVGDEPLLLAQTTTTWIAKDKVAGAKAAVKTGADVILLDDGLQNLSLAKDYSIVVVDGEYGLGNSLIFPAGPLRESVSHALKKANIILILGKDKHNLIAQWQDKYQLFTGVLEPLLQDIEALKGFALYAFAGIGRPEKFFNMLRQYHLNVIKEKSFPDHYPFQENDLKDIRAQAQNCKAQLVTTAKDLSRIPKIMHNEIKIVRIEPKIEQESLFFDFIYNVASHEKNF